jgi:DNA polymerase III epsilon subunit-like protein
MRFTRWEAFLESLEAPLVFYDLETTHMQPERAHIVEFGAAMYGPSDMLPEGAEPPIDTRSLIPGLLYTFEQRVNPGGDVLALGAFRRASKIHHITAADLRDLAFTANDLQDTAAAVLGSGTVCGFNSAEYDDAVMWPGCPDHVMRTRVDVLRVVRAVFAANPIPEVEAGTFDPIAFPPGAFTRCGIGIYKETLSALSMCLLGAAHIDAHGALPDCLRSAEILAALMELWPTTCPNTLAGLMALTRHPDGDTPPNLRKWDGWDRMLKREDGEWVFMRGKWRGCALDEARRGYLQWMLTDKAGFGADTKAVIRAHLGYR